MITPIDPAYCLASILVLRPMPSRSQDPNDSVAVPTPVTESPIGELSLRIQYRRGL